MPFFPARAPKGHSLAEFIHEEVCSSDAVVVGHITGKQSYLTENKDWVFTDYDFVVDEAFKSPDAQLHPGSQITVTRTGGELIIYGHPVKATESSYPPFQLGDTYALFLKFLPSSGSYQAVKEGSSYKVDSGKISKLTRGTLIPELNRPFDWQTFQNEVRISATSTCDSTKGGSK
ncbi:MAG: hypothetical protein LAO06_15645 [Acidobacteriia bacterium]|nr:hypothetical protein [Terriglobia bacterium]